MDKQPPHIEKSKNSNPSGQNAKIKTELIKTTPPAASSSAAASSPSSEGKKVVRKIQIKRPGSMKSGPPKAPAMPRTKPPYKKSENTGTYTDRNRKDSPPGSRGGGYSRRPEHTRSSPYSGNSSYSGTSQYKRDSQSQSQSQSQGRYGAGPRSSSTKAFLEKRHRNSGTTSPYARRARTVSSPEMVRLRSDDESAGASQRAPADDAAKPFRKDSPGFPPKGGKPRAPRRAHYHAGARRYPKKKNQRFQEKQIVPQVEKPKQRNVSVPDSINIMEYVTVFDLAKKMNIKASDIIARLMGMGMMVTINEQIDAEVAELVAGEYNCKVNVVSLYNETIIKSEEIQAERLLPRTPVITVMGHVDHGKTKLLDTIRSENVIGGEHGGITQHIGAYQIVHNDHPITFLDTPGHAAFTIMRARGVKVTDIVVLVVAADDGVMPQTQEAIDHAKAGKVPIIVAINKIDLEDANPDRVRQQLSDMEIVPEEWGGNTIFCEISALNGDGIDHLMESIILQAEVLELKADASCRAEGTVIESRIDAGKGIVATVILSQGTLKIGDNFLSGIYPGKVRTLFNDMGTQIKSVLPAMPCEVVGFTGLPHAGDPFQVTENEKIAKQIGTKRQSLEKLKEMGNASTRKVTLENLYQNIKNEAMKELRVVIKGDVHGSVEAIQSALEKASNEEIRINIVRSAAGAINETDVMLASTSNAIVIGFHVRPTDRAQMLADREKVEIRRYSVIHDVMDDMHNAMEGMLDPELHEELIGKASVRNIFKVSKIGTIAGCFVDSGRIERGTKIVIYRDSVELFQSTISSLKRFQDDASKVAAGSECGIGVANFNDIKVGDQFEIYKISEIERKLKKNE